MQNPSIPTVVVGVDYSETSVLALRRGLALAPGGTVHVIHAIEGPSGAGGPPGMMLAAPLEDPAMTLARYVDQQLSEAFGSATQAPAHVVSHLVVGFPAHEIVQLASDLEADIIVVGTHGRRGVERLLLGSTAERVVRLATCPVLVERPKASIADRVPRIEPPCPRCVETRRSTSGAEIWCAQHRERHGSRHTYHASESIPAFPSAHGGLSSIS
jgi:nucleotide-binding universal stress UspA family protein